MILRCTICKSLFDTQWVGDEVQTICDECWDRNYREAQVLPFRRPA